MKRVLFICISLYVFLFVGCPVNTETENTDTGTTTNSENSGKAEIKFDNRSDYDVNVYVGETPYYGYVYCTIASHSNEIKYLYPATHPFGDTFYFEYMIPVGPNGNVKIPNFTSKEDIGIQTKKLELGETNVITIKQPDECSTKSAFFLIENKSKKSVYLKSGSSTIFPMGRINNDDVYIANGETAVYELNRYKSFSFSLGAAAHVVFNAITELSLPISTVEEGMIYTMTVTADKVTLKSITPFDIDIQNQIWTRNVNSSYNVQCVRQASDKNGIVVLSTATNTPNAIICDKYDRYNKRISSESFTYAKETGTVTNIVIFDCLEIGDGVIVMLAQIGLGDGSIETHLLCYDCKNRTLQFDYRFDTEYNWKFRMNMQNSIVQVSDGKYAVVGGCVYADNSMAAFIAKIDATDKDNIIVTRKMSDVTSDATKTEEFPNGVETMFTSVYYDGTDFYACGYENCDFKYSSNNIHKGVIYKIDSNLQTWENVYNKNKTLLFGIVGEDNHYWACGEYADNGNILKGCLVCDSTSDLLSFPAESNRYLWFNQIAVSGDKLLLCGPDAENMDGSGNACSVVMAVDKDNKTELWSNTFNNYSDALSCIPNGIGSYIVQLKNESSTVIKSADLLGR